MPIITYKIKIALVNKF